MPKRLFISSTCYDLHEARRAIEAWAIPSFVPLLSDRANFPVDPGMHRHDVCTSIAASADLMVVVVAGRLGAPHHADQGISVTWAEFRAASANHVPLVVFVDRRVWEERDAYRRDQLTPLTVTRDVAIFEFLSEIQAHPQGYWMGFYESVDEISERLNALTSLFPIRLSKPAGGICRDGKHIVVASLSPEAQHHVRHTVGVVEFLAEECILQALQAIPLEGQITDSPPIYLHGFSVLVSSAGSEGAVVRASPLGESIRDELEFALLLL